MWRQSLRIHRGISNSTSQLHSLAALLNKLGHQSRPSGLVACSDASAIVAMKVLMEIDEVAPVWIVLKFLEPAINWAMSIA
jgi:DNA-binding LacI/PurR family transcriptional regulator